MKKFLLLLLKIYQKFFTIIGYGSCRYYPTCSEYAKWQIENNNILQAFFNSGKRILKCNQLFKGGIDYPLIKKSFKYRYKRIDVKYWYIPQKRDKKNSFFKNRENGYFYVIKNFKEKYDR